MIEIESAEDRMNRRIKLLKLKEQALELRAKVPEEIEQKELRIAVDGLDGKDGRDGIDGKDGLQGSQGEPGCDGLDGKPGKDGIDGTPGPQGEPGPQGPEGKPGKDGKEPIIEFAEGKDYDRLKINGKVKGPHLTGPEGKGGKTIAVGVSGGGTQIQSDWTQTITTELDYIKNKPSLMNNTGLLIFTYYV